MKNMLPRNTVFARPLCRYSIQVGPVSIFAHEQMRHLCIIRSDLTGGILGVSIAIRPAECLVREDINREAVPVAVDNTAPRFPGFALRPQHEVDNDY